MHNANSNYYWNTHIVMEKNTIKEIIKALKRLIYELKKGYCNELNSDQLQKLENGFSDILEVEREINKNKYDRLHEHSNHNRFLTRMYSWNNIFHSLLPAKKK